jgi:O-antigen ligase/polysaccharide polymerase Wzy-like membrane protein
VTHPNTLAPLVLRAALVLGSLAGPFVLAFFSGGFFAGPRLVAGIAAWALLAVVLVLRPRAGSRRGGRVSDHSAVQTDIGLRPQVQSVWPAEDRPPAGSAVSSAGPHGAALATFAGLVGLVMWTAVSSSWAPIGSRASDSLELSLLYLGALGAAFVIFAPPRARRLVEPGLALGAVVVIGYGVAGRVLPDLVSLSRTRSAGGRLDQPLTYWNATGALAALGLVLCARLAGDRSRPLALRAAAAAGAAPLGLGVYLSFSRGALTALGVGLAVLIAVAPTWPQLRSAAIALEAGAACAGVASLLPAVEAAEGDSFAAQGAVLLVVLLAVMAGAAAMQVWSARAEEDGTTRVGALARAVPRWALVVAALLAVAPFAAAAIDPGDKPADPAFGATAQRFGSVGSRRFDYWEAALSGFADHPLKGVGAGGYAATWLKERDVRERVVDAHSLELETAAELGLVGLALLALLLGGVATAARRTAEEHPGIAAGLAVYAAHSAIDWDWEMPALTLVAVVLAGAALAAADRAPQLGEQRPLAR